MDDSAAARACRAGEVDAFRHFVERYQTRALAHAQLLTRNHADAADAVQEAFLDAFRNMAAFDAARAFYPWFYVLLRNRCFKQQSRRGTRAESAELSDPPVEAAVSEEYIDLWRAISRLPSKAAELVVLKHVEGWTYEELSQALNVPRGTLMSRLYAARQQLMALLSGEAT
jgi:RNA polymerase sigma-70 factor, ECF subfamily